MKKILALLLAVMFVFSAMPVYAAEVETVTVEPRATVCNVANYLTNYNVDVHQFTITKAGTYTVTIVVDRMNGNGANVSFARIAHGTCFAQDVADRYQGTIWLDVGTYNMNVKANGTLAYSVTIGN